MSHFVTRQCIGVFFQVCSHLWEIQKWSIMNPVAIYVLFRCLWSSFENSNQEKKQPFQFQVLKRASVMGSVTVEWYQFNYFCVWFFVSSISIPRRLTWSLNWVMIVFSLKMFFFYRLHTFFSGFVGGWLVNSQIRIQSYYSSLGHGSIIVQSLVVFCVWPNGVRR